MTRGIAKIHKRSRPVKQRKGGDMKTMTLETEQRAGKRSSAGKQGAEKSQQRQRRLQVELMKTELAKMKGEIRDSAESLLAAKIEANQTQAKFEQLITTRNELMENLLEMKATEAFLMGFL